MVKKVLWYLLWFVIAFLILAWFVGGGFGKIKTAAQELGNPLSGGLSGLIKNSAIIILPWAVPIPQGPDISNLVENGSGQDNSQASTFGNTSPSSGGFSISTDGAIATSPNGEYVIVQNTGTTPVDITGWSLQSAISGARSYIPRGASFFALGALNTQTDVDLAPGGSAIITTGSSPVGTSFRENECSGYLAQVQSFSPALQWNCPSEPYDAATYGKDCTDYVNSIPPCTFERSVPSNLSSACAQYVQTTFSYNGCVQAHQNDTSFASKNWRVYLNGVRELWGNSHDTIRLLDAQGRIVASTSY